MRTILVVNAEIESGKDTFLNFLNYRMSELYTGNETEEYLERFKNRAMNWTFKNLKIAEGPKKIVSGLLKVNPELLEDRVFKETIQEDFSGEIQKNTTRDLVIKVAESLKNEIHDRIWINDLLRKIKEFKENFNFCITDWRFLCEIKAIEDFCEKNQYRLIKIKIERDQLKNVTIDSNFLYTEQDLKDYTDFDIIIKNNYGLKELMVEIGKVVKLIDNVD
jgi:hypothetical protein